MEVCDIKFINDVYYRYGMKGCGCGAMGRGGVYQSRGPVFDSQQITLALGK